MDLLDLDSFFSYECYTSDDVQPLVDDIIKSASYLGPMAREQIQYAYAFAEQAHADIKRLSGERYIVHPLKATKILMDLKPDLATIQACILHDVIEDTQVTYEDICGVFGKEVGDLCEGLVKVSSLRYKGEERQIETLSKTFLAMAKDLRVIFVKLADRIHNIQTLEYHPKEEKRRRIAEETMKIYVPIARRLGLYHFQILLENGAFRILYPQEYLHIFSFLQKKVGSQQKYIDKGIKQLTDMLHKEGMKGFEVKGRMKSPYRIFEKLHHKYKSKDFSQVMDLVAYRILTKSVADCYMILGIMHKHFTPLINKIKDYIAVPKFNGYKSIHTTVLGMGRLPVEIQIRTSEMDDVAEYGVAAHFAYSENSGSTLLPENQSQWIERLQKVVHLYKSSEDKERFKDQLSLEVLNKSTFLYTPKGDVIELPQGSTVLDFAFSIHSDIGLRFKNALVNREIKPITYVPNTGDVISINTFKHKYTANKHRLEFLNTPSAKSKLVKFLRTQEDDDLLAHELDQLQHSIHVSEQVQKSKKHIPHTHISLPVHAIVIDEDKQLLHQLCGECIPTYPQKIIAKTGRSGIIIHTMNCKALRTVSFDYLLEAHWADQHIAVYTGIISCIIPNTQNNLLTLIGVFSGLYVSIGHIAIENMHNDKIKVKITCDVTNPGKLGLVLKDLKKYHDSIQVSYKKIS